ncbi:16S rRNA (cytidine1402-2'-O)-methyltransferase [Sporomusaceae bacterium BoRhaA]|uniref:16S rRNA (cytidine(1402)-2'-O)-methyltransferase n=1 Tax=Pelorhabdus rhamnosifermentans TaxID=2772457 RepID=UPI001C061C35|nr:16S rRNA (cytidine(1402)-2'-O)-methyltransferase [Pelorhabdus rhamnosifermentans]MBU2702092.1 16S rRNA (cytidine1402-2'-O)-methyltransferase [Pelorhabdus rhamnosifermentans]
MAGTLYLCATPIGNLEDITYRALRCLREVAVVAAEDTRHTRKLFTHFDIHTTLTRYDEHSKEQAGPYLIDRLLGGDDVAVVSDAGMPGISDPGSDLVRRAILAKISVVPLPGANAALSALIASGLDTTAFTFLGFLPKTKKKQQEMLSQFVEHPYTLIFYESPHHLLATLGILQEMFGDRSVAVGRELTKKFEEFIRGSLSGVMTHFQAVPPRGEFTIVLAGATCETSVLVNEPPSDAILSAAVEAFVAGGLAKKEAMRQVAVQYNLSKRDVYQALLK